MPRILTKDALAQYRRDGFYFPVRVMSTAEAREYRARLQASEAELGGPLRGDFMYKPHLLFTWVNELVHHPRILDAVEDIIGPDILCWGTDFFIKEGHDPNFVSWHQDATYWGLEPPEAVTAWVALSDAPVASGAMKFLSGSHREPIPHVIDRHPDNLLERGQNLAVEVDESRAVDVELEAGQISLHDIWLAHGSKPNDTDDRRIGFAIRYIPPHVRQVKVRDSAMLVRGRDRYGHFQPEPAPVADLDHAARAAHRETVERLGEVLAGQMRDPA